MIVVAGVVIGLLVLPLAALAVANAWVLLAAHGRVFADVDAVPRRGVGLVPGTSRLSRAGFENRHFWARVRAAADAYHADAVATVVVSGGPREVAELTEAVTALGVPASAVIGDPAGLDTLSTVRWAAARGVRKVVVIGQPWHVPRAVFLAAALGVDAVAYAPPGVGLWTSLRFCLVKRRRPVRVREWLARVKAVLVVLRGQAGPPAPVPDWTEVLT